MAGLRCERRFEAQAAGGFPVGVGGFQAVVPAARLHVGFAHFDAVGGGVLHELRGRVEAHRQAVQEPAVERARLEPLEPGGNVDQEGEAR